MWKVALAFLAGLCCVHNLAQLPGWAVAAGFLLGITALAAIGRALQEPCHGLLQRSLRKARCALRSRDQAHENVHDFSRRSAARAQVVFQQPARCSRGFLAFAAGLAWAWLNAAIRLAGDLPPALEGQDLLVQGDIISLPQAQAEDPQFVLQVAAAERGVPARIRLTWYRAPEIPHAGEQWQLVVRLKRRSGFANPGGFDYEGQLFRQGIGASGYVRDDARNRRLARAAYRHGIVQLRAWIARRIEQAVEDKRMLGVLQGLAVGDTHAMSADHWRVFAATGTTHLMAISGLHISMIAALAAWLGGRIVIRMPFAQSRGWSAMHGQVIAGAAAAVAYSVLAGLSVPTQRTLVMLCLYFASRWWRRDSHLMHSLGLALLGVLLLDPFAPLAAGAWLSFVAVVVIAIAIAGRMRPSGTIGSFARIQGAITIGLTPVLLGSFGGLSLAGPLANAVAVPLFTLFVVPTVLLGTLLASIHLSSGGWVLGLSATLLEWLWPVLEWLAGLPWAYRQLPAPSLPAFAALIVGTLLLILPGIWPTRLAGALLCAPALLSFPARPAQGDFDLAVLDVGQGLAAVVRTRAHVLVYDAGPQFRSGRDAAELALLPYLHHGGIGRIDALVISHGDLDHRGGMGSVRATMRVARLLAGPTVVQVPGATRCRRGQRWSWDGVRFEVLHPGATAYERDNDSSCVLRIESAAGSVLLPGDIEAAAEAELLHGGLPRTDVVVVPHHGSGTSSTPALVAALHPAWALTSAGYRNRWSLPKREVVARWRAGGARPLDTARSGAIEVAFRAGKEPEVREYRRAHRRYWQR